MPDEMAQKSGYVGSQAPVTVADTTVTDHEAEWRALIPDEYQRLGWSGTFIQEATLSEPERAAEFEAKLPARVPFGSNSGWLALCLNRTVDPPTVVLVRRDENAIMDLVRGPRR